MNSYEIESILNNDKFVKKFFLGVFPENHLKKLRKLNENQSIVIWTCSYPLHINNICHFVVIYRNKKSIFFFDPLSIFPTFYEFKNIKNYLLKHNLSIKINRIRYQHPLSTKCGSFCLFFLLIKYRGINEKYFKNIFDLKKLENNDKIVLKMLKKLSRK